MGRSARALLGAPVRPPPTLCHSLTRELRNSQAAVAGPLLCCRPAAPASGERAVLSYSKVTSQRVQFISTSPLSNDTIRATGQDGDTRRTARGWLLHWGRRWRQRHGQEVDQSGHLKTRQTSLCPKDHFGLKAQRNSRHRRNSLPPPPALQQAIRFPLGGVPSPHCSIRKRK